MANNRLPSNQSTRFAPQPPNLERNHPGSGSFITDSGISGDDMLKSVGKFRILSVGRSGVGKSSLINNVLGIKNASVSYHNPRVSDIYQEHVSGDNGYFILHDSQGFEPGDHSSFKAVRTFLEERSRQGLPLKDRVHGLWFCVETPTAGGRLFETGDEEILKFAQKIQLPVVIVFTQYDRLVRTKRAELKEDNPVMNDDTLNSQSVEEARKAFGDCLQPLERSMRRLGIKMPPYAKVSVRPNFQEGMSELVQVTRNVVKGRIEGDVWVMWAMAQRASLPIKIEHCIVKGMSGYTRGLAGGAERTMLHDRLIQIHDDVVTCWNFQSEILYSEEFKRSMLYLVQDVIEGTQPQVSAIARFVDLVKAPIAPPVAIPGLTSNFAQWLSITALENEAPVQRLLIAYAVDLIRVLRELFDFALRPGSKLTITWSDLREALETFARSPSRQNIHRSICSNTLHDGWIVTASDIGKKLGELLEK